MTPSTILKLYTLILLGVTVLEEVLILLNLRHTRRGGNTIPPALADQINDETFKRSIDYTLTRGRFALISELTDKGFLLMLALSGFLGFCWNFWESLLPGNILIGLALIATLSLLTGLMDLPFSLYSQFRIEEKFGFNKMTLPLYFKDKFKGILVSLLVGLPLLALVFLFIETTGDLWWIIALTATLAFQMLMTLIYPLWIAPLFNKFTPLEEGALKEKLLALAEKAQFPVQGIFVMDGSRRSGHSNAYFTGFGKARRIVLYDTLIESLTEEELAGVLAHEIGHWKKKHILTMYFRSAGVLTLFFLLLQGAMQWDALSLAFHLPPDGAIGTFVLAIFFFSPFTVLLTPLASLLTRRHEYEADAYARELTGSAEPLKAALIKLSRDNLANLIPHPAYSFFYYSHPVVTERIKALEKGAETSAMAL